MAEFRERAGGAKRSFASKPLREIRALASEIVEEITGYTAAACLDEKKHLREGKRMGEHFDVPSEADVLQAAMMVYRQTTYADSSYLPPTEFADMARERARENSVGTELRELDVQVKALKKAVKECVGQLRECALDVEEDSREERRLRAYRKQMKGYGEKVADMEQSLDELAGMLRFRAGRGKGGGGVPGR